MKKAIRLIATILVVCVVVIALNLLIEGVPLLGTPKLENIDQVVVEHSDYPDDVKEYTDENNITLSDWQTARSLKTSKQRLTRLKHSLLS